MGKELERFRPAGRQKLSAGGRLNERSNVRSDRHFPHCPQLVNAVVHDSRSGWLRSEGRMQTVGQIAHTRYRDGQERCLVYSKALCAAGRGICGVVADGTVTVVWYHRVIGVVAAREENADQGAV